MAIVVRIADYDRKPKEQLAGAEPANVIILPVVRIDRQPTKPQRSPA